MASLAVYAEDSLDDALDDALSGFEEESALPQMTRELSTLSPVIKKPSPLQMSGQLSVNSSYAYQESAPIIGNSDYRGLTKLQLAGLLEFDYKISSEWQSKLELKGFIDPIYNIKGRSNYSNDSLNTYEMELEMGEGYFHGSLSENLDIKIGRQIVVWGKSDSIRVNDVMNPLDNRELGMVDIEDLRLPVLMTRLDYFYQDWQLSVLAQHEHRDPKEAAINSEYFPSSVLPIPSGIQFPDIPRQSMQFDETTFSFAAEGRFSGWDLSLYGGRFQDSRWHFTNGVAERSYGLFNMLGASTNVMVDSWLLKAEVALLNELKYNTVPENKERIDLLLGFEYKGIRDMTLSLEVADRSIVDYQPIMKNLPDFVDEHELQTALRVLYSFNHDRATLGYLGQYFGNTFEKGGFHRVWLDYELTQSVNITGGIIDYFGGENPMLDAMRNNDKVFLEATYFF
ncbi:hypothetical protein MNBD_GAMMA04-1494 [hydrothermal vent metagenome]|uniref:DUF1302 domain-containing protein n=1 Tax=hydrothermal vent metagenome TaxID=652676 RepID=A0A3B0W531_9ZZZZ